MLERPLEAILPHTAKDLGIYLSMDGNNQEQIKQMKKKGKAFADQIRTSNLSHSESWHALKTTIMKTMEYPMEAINLKKHEWDNIMTPILQCALPKPGIVQTFP